MEIGGYALAGGRSSRMGREKALLELGGRTLIEHAVRKLGRLCAEVCVLSGNAELARFAPLVGDLHPDCGPIGGVEAALAHTVHDWNLILPVDVPFLPGALLGAWVGNLLQAGGAGACRISMFVVDGVAQPALLLIHRELGAYLSAAIRRGEYKLGPALGAAAREIAATRGVGVEEILARCSIDGADVRLAGPGRKSVIWAAPPGALAASQERDSSLWFSNLNTPEQVIEAERNVAALDV